MYSPSPVCKRHCISLSIFKIQLSDGELAVGSPAFFLFFFLSPQLIVLTVIIEAFYLDKLVTEKGEFVLIIFFKKLCQFSISDWLKSQGKFLMTS